MPTSPSTRAVCVATDGGPWLTFRASYRGRMILDTYVLPTAPVTHYWVENTGIQQQDLGKHSSSLLLKWAVAPACRILNPSGYCVATGAPFADVRISVARAIQGKVIVGHKLWQDLSVGFLHILISYGSNNNPGSEYYPPRPL